MTAADAARYVDAYEHAIHAIGRAAGGRGAVAGPGISVKLSALHPRYSRTQRERVMASSCLRPRSSRRSPGATASASTSTPRKPTGSIFRSTSSRSSRPIRRSRLAGPRLRRPGVSEARSPRDRLDRGARPPPSPAADGPARQGRVLGQRDQARADGRPVRLPGVHAQGAHGRLLSRLREGDARGSGCDLSAVRLAQRVHRRGGVRARRRARLRIPVPARNGREPLR